MSTNRINPIGRYVRNLVDAAFLRVIDPIVSRFERRLTEKSVRDYHIRTWRTFRLLQVHETDTQLSDWYGRMAARHRRYCP